MAVVWGLGPIAALAQEPISNGYVVNSRDVLSVSVFGEESLSGSFMVSEKGAIDLPLLRNVDVAGQTPSEIAELLESLFGDKYLVNPHVSVQVATYGSKPVQVLGAVKNPGVYYLQGPTSILEILALCGGVSSERTLREVHVTHVDSTKTVVKLDDLFGRGEGNLQLKANDVVHIPEGLVVYVAGQVEKPGEVAFSDGLTVTQAITMAGGWKSTASLKYAYILRNGDRTKIHLKKIMQGREADITLEPGDQLFIEESVF